jgi:hypothetical protein
MKLLFTAIALCFVSFVYSQKIVFDKTLNLKREFKGVRDTYPLPIGDKGELVLFLVDPQGIQSVLFDSSYNVLKEIDGVRPTPTYTYDELLGSCINGRKVSLFFSSSNHKKISRSIFDLETGRVWTAPLEIDFSGKEDFVSAITLNGAFFIVTAVKPDAIKVYRFNGPDKYLSVVTDFPKQRFSAEPTTHLYDILTKSPVPTIDNEAPTPLSVASSKVKLYHYSNKIVMSLDRYEFQTILLEIDPSSLNAALRTVNYPSVYKAKYGRVTENSYIHHGILFQLKVSSDEMAIKVFDLSENSEVTQFGAKKDEDIYFNNTPLISNGDLYDEKKDGFELSNTKRFLKKILSMEAAISAFHTEQGLRIEIGGHEEKQAMGSGGTGFSAPGAVGTPFYNPVGSMRSAAKVDLSVAFATLMNPQDFSFKQGKIEPDIFAKINTSMEELDLKKERELLNALDPYHNYDKKPMSETAYRIGEKYYNAYYLQKEKRYVIREYAY